MKLQDFFSITRIPFAFTQTLFVILGFLHAGGRDYFALLLAVLALGPSFLYGGVYILNDVADKQFDLQHPKKRGRVIASGKISVKTALLLSAFLIAVGLAVAVYIGASFALVSLSVLLNNLLYACGPRLKDKLYFGLLSCSLNYPLRFLAGGVAADTGKIAVMPAVLFFFIALNGFSAYRIYDKKSMASEQKSKEDKNLAVIIKITALAIALIALVLGFEKTPLAAVFLAGYSLVFSEVNLRVVSQGIDFFQLMRVHKTMKKDPGLLYYPAMFLAYTALVVYVLVGNAS
ncbi:MAG: hypothetical protein FJY77_03515 [Candidatus Altiarchaeales archaeon]|nr:hypothetical protein [Candidatus Altiarchaeales archaeon]